MKIYCAATFKNQHRIRDMRDRLFLLGHNVLSTWLNEQVKPSGMTEEQFGRKMAAKDLREIQEADCVILDTSDPSQTGGKLIEFGFALAHHKFTLSSCHWQISTSILGRIYSTTLLIIIAREM